jgi:hypothetical protein
MTIETIGIESDNVFSKIATVILELGLENVL